MFRKILKLLIVFILSILIGNMAYGMYQEFHLKEGPNISSLANTEETGETINTEKEEEEIRLIEKIPKQYKGYEVSAKLTIPKIELDTYVLEEYSTETMDLCPTKYFGPEPNEEGNFCIAAHNYNKENMFNHIIELKIGDTIVLLDNKNGRVEYEVYDVYKVKPEETEPLSQKTEGRTELTLITCSDYSSKRIIVKARRI